MNGWHRFERGNASWIEMLRTLTGVAKFHIGGKPRCMIFISERRLLGVLRQLCDGGLASNSARSRQSVRRLLMRIRVGPSVVILSLALCGLAGARASFSQEQGAEEKAAPDKPGQEGAF